MLANLNREDVAPARGASLAEAEMKRAVLLGTAMLAGLLVQGCPIFPDEPYGCHTNTECGDGYRCDFVTGLCEPAPSPSLGTGGSSGIRFCSSPTDCGYSETCTRAGVCLVGDCTATGYGCVAGYVCDAVSGRWACVPETPGAGGSGGETPSSDAGAGGIVQEAGGAGGDLNRAGTGPLGAGAPAVAGAPAFAGAPPVAGGAPGAGAPASAGAPTAGAAGASTTAGAPSVAGAAGNGGASAVAGAPAAAGMASSAGVLAGGAGGNGGAP